MLAYVRASVCLSGLFLLTPVARVQLFGFEIFCTIIFTIEFIVRLLVAQTYCPKCDAKAKESGKHDADTPFFTQLFTYLDFLAILPFYVEVTAATLLGQDGSVTNKAPGALVFLDFFKLFRIARVIKLIRLYKRSAILIRTFSLSLPTISLSITLLTFLFTTGGSLLLFMEPCNGEPFTTDCEFPDIVQSGYYTWITVFSIGYGDQVPQYIPAKIVGMIFMILGTIFLAMPLTIIGTLYDESFNVHEEKEQRRKQTSVEKDDLPKAERKMRLLKTGMLAFNSILQAKQFLDANANNLSDAEEKSVKEEKSVEEEKSVKEEKSVAEEKSVEEEKSVKEEKSNGSSDDTKKEVCACVSAC